MRKKWLVIGGVGLVVLMLIAGSLLFNRAQGNSCEQFLKATLENDAKGSYNLLSDDVKTRISPEEWEQKVAAYFFQYKSTNTTYKLDKTINNVDPDNGTTTTTEQYLITTASGKARGTCHLDNTGKMKAYTDEQVYE